MTNYKALMLDVDGTLARADLYVSPRVAEAVGRASDRMAVALVTSRDHIVVGELAGRIGLKGLQVSEGGARIFDQETREPAWLCSLAPVDAQGIIRFLEANGHPFTAVDGDRRVQSSQDVTDWCVTRITAISLTQTQAHEIAARFGDQPGVHTTVIVRIDNGDWMVDFTHAEATKATAVERYARLNGIEASQIIAAGDSYNDLPLLKACGLSIAMGNAAPELKAIADYVAPDVDDDGLAVAIDEFVLPALDDRAR